jgi:hypothetical protein
MGFEPIIMCGVELEFEYNVDALGALLLNGYHDECHIPKKFGSKFIGEVDGSIRCNTFTHPGAAEIISYPFNLDDWESMIGAFEGEVKRRIKAKLNTEGDTLELADAISFNSSTGAHVHLGLYKPSETDKCILWAREKGEKIELQAKEVIFRDSVNEKVLIGIKERLKSKVKKAHPLFYRVWQRDLLRGSMSTAMGEKINYSDRYCEWNLAMNYNRIEYRGFHLHGVKTWSRFKEMFGMLFSSIKEVICEEFNKEKPFYSDPVPVLQFAGSPLDVERVEDVNILLPRVSKRRRYVIELDGDLEDMEVR